MTNEFEKLKIGGVDIYACDVEAREDIAQLQALYEALSQTPPEPLTWSEWQALIADTSQLQQGVIYRVTAQDGNSYSDYMWNGTTIKTMATYDNATDEVPTENSNNLVKSGGVYAALSDINNSKPNVEDLLETEAYAADFDELPKLCGQPMILFGNGTPQEAVVPDNWIQFLDGGYNWTGVPSALGQQYVNYAVSQGGHYVAVRNGQYGLKWVNS